jgi:hypothetical protein
MQATTVKLSATALKLTTDTVKGDMGTQKKWVKLSDTYRAEGVTSAMLETEKKGGSVDLRDQVKSAIVLSFSEGDRALLATDTKALDDVNKMLKKEVQQSIGAYLSKIQSHIAKAEKAEEEGEESAAKTEVQRIHELLDKAITKMQKLDAPSFDVTDAVKRIKAIKGTMPAL